MLVLFYLRYIYWYVDLSAGLGAVDNFPGGGGVKILPAWGRGAWEVNNTIDY